MSEPDDSIWRRPTADDGATAQPEPAAEAAEPGSDASEPAVAHVEAPAGEAPPLPYVAAVPAPSRATVQGPSLARSFAVLLLFVAGIAAGIVGFVGLNPAPNPTPYPRLAGVPEPESAHGLAAALEANDADAVANRVLPPIAHALSNALQPIVEVTDVTYLGTVEHDGRDLAGYIVTGHDDQSQDEIVGVVVDVLDGNIVGINQ